MYNSKETTLSNHYMPDFSDTNEETKAANIAEFLTSCEENGNPILFDKCYKQLKIEKPAADIEKIMSERGQEIWEFYLVKDIQENVKWLELAIENNTGLVSKDNKDSQGQIIRQARKRFQDLEQQFRYDYNYEGCFNAPSDCHQECPMNKCQVCNANSK